MYMILMRVSGMSVPEAVREIITRNRSVYDCMRMNVINYTALAVKIRPDVERETGRPVNLNTVVVAIKRYADSFGRRDNILDDQVLKNARLSLTDGILDIRLSVEEVGMEPADILSKFAEATDNYDFFRMADSVRFLAEDMESVRKVLGELSGERAYSSGLARIKVTTPPGRSRPDIISYIAEVLHSNGIELKNAFFSEDATTLVVDERHASRAYEVLRADIVRKL